MVYHTLHCGKIRGLIWAGERGDEKNTVFSAVTGVMHQLSDTYSILAVLPTGSISHTSIQYMDFVIIFISLVLLGVEVPFCLFSRVKLIII